MQSARIQKGAHLAQSSEGTLAFKDSRKCFQMGNGDSELDCPLSKGTEPNWALAWGWGGVMPQDLSSLLFKCFSHEDLRLANLTSLVGPQA